jgi:hypothetical protein
MCLRHQQSNQLMSATIAQNKRLVHIDAITGSDIDHLIDRIAEGDNRAPDDQE